MIVLRFIRSILDQTLFNPRHWVLWAVLFLAAFAVVHLLGWRDATSIISGTLPTGGSPDTALLQGALYTLTWFGAILLAPILLLAAVLHFLLGRLFPGRAGAVETVSTTTAERTGKEPQ